MRLQRNVELSDGDCRELFILLNKPFYMHGITQYRPCIHQPANSQLSQNNLTGCCQLEILRIWSLAPLHEVLPLCNPLPTNIKKKQTKPHNVVLPFILQFFKSGFQTKQKFSVFYGCVKAPPIGKLAALVKGKLERISLFYFILITSNKKLGIHRKYN